MLSEITGEFLVLVTGKSNSHWEVVVDVETATPTGPGKMGGPACCSFRAASAARAAPAGWLPNLCFLLCYAPFIHSYSKC